jgi:hypothetical protein
MIQGPNLARGVSWVDFARALVGVVAEKGVGEVGPER